MILPDENLLMKRVPACLRKYNFSETDVFMAL